MRLVAACVVALAAIAAAQPNPDDVKRAAQLYDEGKRHFDIAEYTAAIASWKQAYLLSAEPLLLFNIAQAHRLAGDCAQANRFYLNYKRVQPKPPNQAELDSAMTKCAGVAPATGDTTPGGLDPSPSPSPSGSPSPSVEPSPSPTPPAHHEMGEVDQGKNLRIAGIAVAGAGVVAGIAATVFAFEARSKANEIESKPAGTPWDKTLQGTQSDGKSAQTNARIFAVIGVAAAATGAALWFYGRSKSAVQVDLSVTPQSTQVGLTCDF